MLSLNWELPKAWGSQICWNTDLHSHFQIGSLRIFLVKTISRRPADLTPFWRGYLPCPQQLLAAGTPSCTNQLRSTHRPFISVLLTHVLSWLQEIGSCSHPRDVWITRTPCRTAASTHLQHSHFLSTGQGRLSSSQPPGTGPGFTSSTEQRKRSVPPTKEKPPPALFEASLPMPLLKDITPASSLAELKRGRRLVNKRQQCCSTPTRYSSTDCSWVRSSLITVAKSLDIWLIQTNAFVLFQWWKLNAVNLRKPLSQTE